MFSQVTDFSRECLEFASLIDEALDTHGQQLYAWPTQFKQWTLNDIVGHLHVWNWAADASLHHPDQFKEFMALLASATERHQLRDFERQWLKGLEGDALVSTWRDFAQTMCARFEHADPRARVQWVGPEMSVRSSVSARLMETWAHAQAVYDLVGVERSFHDRLQNLVVLGVNTYGWAFKNRDLTPPEPRPFVSLILPSGARWEDGNAANSNSVTGSAADFCQVVTQVRNVADTRLKVTGDIAQRWMRIAQCFAGGPASPPAPGERFCRTRTPS